MASNENEWGDKARCDDCGQFVGFGPHYCPPRPEYKTGDKVLVECQLEGEDGVSALVQVRALDGTRILHVPLSSVRPAKEGSEERSYQYGYRDGVRNERERNERYEFGIRPARERREEG